MPHYERIAVVTGSNKGVGLAIVRQLALQYPKSPANNGAFLIYLTARDRGRGEAALQSIKDDSQLKSAKALASDGGPTDVEYHELDISKTDSIRAFSAHLKERHPAGIDFCINNAGIAMDGFNNDVVEQTLHSNYYGTMEATQDFLPQIRPGGRLVNVASRSGQLRKYSDPLQKQFLAAKTRDDVTSLMESFKTAVRNGSEKQEGWPSAAYGVSKCGVIGMTKAIAMEQQEKGSTVLINSCCPGYVNTDMTKGNGMKTPDQGAQTPVMLALHDIGGQSGLFWRNQKVIEW